MSKSNPFQSLHYTVAAAHKTWSIFFSFNKKKLSIQTRGKNFCGEKIWISNIIIEMEKFLLFFAVKYGEWMGFTISGKLLIQFCEFQTQFYYVGIFNISTHCLYEWSSPEVSQIKIHLNIFFISVNFIERMDKHKSEFSYFGFWFYLNLFILHFYYLTYNTEKIPCEIV